MGVAAGHVRVVPLRRPVPGGGVQELLIAAHRYREPVQPDRPCDPAQHQVVTRPYQVDTRGNHAVARRAGRGLAPGGRGRAMGTG